MPQAEIDKRISKQEVAMRALERSQNKMIQDILGSKEFKDSNCIDSVSKMEVVKLEPTPVLKINFELVPEVLDFKSKDVKDITLPPFNAPKVSDEMVKQQIKMMIKPDAMVSAKKDGVVAKGNIAVIDFKGFVDGKPFKGGEGKNFELEIGSKSFIDNFEDQLVGCKKNDMRTVSVTFPKEYGVKDLAGKPAKFEVVIKDVKEIEYPEITKDYCKKFAMDCANMEELEKHIKKLFIQEAEMRYQDMAVRIINDAIAKKAKLSYYPRSLIEMHKRQIMGQYEQEAKRAGFKTLDQYKKAIGLDNKKFEEVLDSSAHSTLNVALTYEKLIEEYKLKVTEADSKDYLDKLTRYVGGDAKKAKEMYEKNKEYADSNILRDKLFKKLIEECKKEAPKAKENK
ncbi:MAG: trigger factor [Mycoplasmoidaceae bacterium]|nr:trigger factor [Mycoplasmoidaceae bacterium]